MPISGGITVPEFHIGLTDPETMVWGSILSGIVTPAGVTQTNEPIPETLRRWVGVMGTISGVLSGSTDALSGMQHEMALRTIQLEQPGLLSAAQITAANAIITASGEITGS